MSHESDSQGSVRRTRGDARTEEADLVSYQNEAGDSLVWTGDDDAPYVKAVGVVLVEGDIAAGEPDAATSNPVKIGGTAVDFTSVLAFPPTPVTTGDRVDALFDLIGRLGVVPFPTLQPTQALVSDADLEAAGAFLASAVLDVTEWRRLTLFLRYIPGAAGGFPQVVPLGSSEAGAAPSVTSDVWYGLEVDDGSVTPTLIAGAFPAATDVTIEPEWGSVTMRPIVIRTEAGNAVTDQIRMRISLDVTDLKWVYVLYAEAGVIGTPGNFGLRYCLST